MNRIGCVLVAVASIGSMGCSAGSIEDVDSSVEEGEVGKITQAFAEIGCALQQCTDANHCYSRPPGVCSAGPTVSRIPNYGSPECLSQIVNRASSIPPMGRLQPNFWWGGPAMTQSNCTTAIVETALFKKVGTAPPELSGTQLWRGRWNGSNCVLSSSTQTPFVVSNGTLTDVRVSGTAWHNGAQVPVHLGLRHLCPAP